MKNLKIISILLVLTFLMLSVTACGGSERNATVTGEVISDSKYSVGDIIYLGKYSYDGVEENGAEDICWTILDIQHGKALILSKYIIAEKTYTADNKSPDWESSDLRKWLNKEFFDGAFTDEEKKLIAESIVPRVGKSSNVMSSNAAIGSDTAVSNKVTSSSAAPSVNESVDTTDKVFILSDRELRRYMSTEDERAAECSYWSRSGESMFCYTSALGHSNNTGGFSNKTEYGVRPAMWIEIK